jgi:Protein of unknown function (DUF3540)
MTVQTEQSVYVGPAWIRRANGRRVEIELPCGKVWAEMALGYPYEPVAGDTVLAIGQLEQYYVIGVLKGSGQTTLSVPGDLSIQAPHGRIDIQSGKGMRLRSPHISVAARQLSLVADTVRERFTEAARWVKEVCQVRAGTLQNIASGDYSVRAERISERANSDVKIDGRKIDLG